MYNIQTGIMAKTFKDLKQGDKIWLLYHYSNIDLDVHKYPYKIHSGIVKVIFENIGNTYFSYECSFDDGKDRKIVVYKKPQYISDHTIEILDKKFYKNYIDASLSEDNFCTTCFAADKDVLLEYYDALCASWMLRNRNYTYMLRKCYKNFRKHTREVREEIINK